MPTGAEQPKKVYLRIEGGLTNSDTKIYVVDEDNNEFELQGVTGCVVDIKIGRVNTAILEVMPQQVNIKSVLDMVKEPPGYDDGGYIPITHAPDIGNTVQPDKPLQIHIPPGGNVKINGTPIKSTDKITTDGNYVFINDVSAGALGKLTVGSSFTGGNTVQEVIFADDVQILEDSLFNRANEKLNQSKNHLLTSSMHARIEQNIRDEKQYRAYADQIQLYPSSKLPITGL